MYRIFSFFYSFCSYYLNLELDNFLRNVYSYLLNFIGFLNLNTFVFSCSNLRLLTSLVSFLYRFFESRKIFFFISHFNVISFYEGFNLFGWKFFLLKSDFFSLQLSRDTIFSHQLTLKNLVKFGSNLFILVEQLNLKIFSWVLNYFFSDFVVNVFLSLDIFLYKLLWNFLKRRHPRRPRTWIYNKYWKFYNRFWCFFVYDFYRGKMLFLSLHSFFSIPVFRNHFFFNTFEYFNRNKLYSIYSKRSLCFVNKFLFYLWKKQSGLCLVCYQLFDFSKQFIFKVVPWNSFMSYYSRSKFYKSHFLFAKFVLVVCRSFRARASGETSICSFRRLRRHRSHRAHACAGQANPLW